MPSLLIDKKSVICWSNQKNQNKMATKNSITGDEIKSKILSAQGRKNHDRIFAKKSAHEWLKDETVTVIDPDGWRWDDGVTMETPIPYIEFQKRLMQCTVLGFVQND